MSPSGSTRTRPQPRPQPDDPESEASGHGSELEHEHEHEKTEQDTHGNPSGGGSTDTTKTGRTKTQGHGDKDIGDRDESEVGGVHGADTISNNGDHSLNTSERDGEGRLSINKPKASQIGRKGMMPGKVLMMQDFENKEPAGEIFVEPTGISLHSVVNGLDRMFSQLLLRHWVSGSGLVRGIANKSMQSIVQSTVQRPSYVIIDLRNDIDVGSDNPRQIPGARHLPLSFDPKNGELDYKKLVCMPNEYDRTQQRFKDMMTRWDRLYANQELPLHEAIEKSYIFFHCQNSQNRTPMVATGFKMWAIYNSIDVEVACIEGGYAEWTKAGLGVEDFKGSSQSIDDIIVT